MRSFYSFITIIETQAKGLAFSYFGSSLGVDAPNTFK